MAMYTENQTTNAVEKQYASAMQGAGVVGRQFAVDQAVPAPPVSAITDARRTFEDARNLSARVKDIVGRIVGYMPEDPNKIGLESAAIFDGLKSDAIDTRSIISEAMQALNRLESQLP